MTETILNKGREGSRLFVYSHIDPTLIKDRVKAQFPNDTVVVYLMGNGTDAYRPLLPSFHSWPEWVSNLAEKVGHGFSKTVLTGWSAGGQVIKDVATAGIFPDVIVALDAIYGSKPATAKQGDGSIIMDKGIQGLVDFAQLAALGSKTFVSTYSNIVTTYASTKECNRAIVGAVCSRMGVGFGPDTFREELNHRKIKDSVRFGSLYTYEFAGNDKAEHIAAAHMYSEIWSGFSI